MSVDPQALRRAEQLAVQARADARSMAEQNRKLQETLRAARDRLTAVNKRLEAMVTPPLNLGTCLTAVDDGLVDVWAMGRRLRVSVDPELGADALAPGATVLVNESLVVVGLAADISVGELAVVVEVLADGRLVVARSASSDQVVQRGAHLPETVRAGDSVLVDDRAMVALARVEREGIDDVVLEEIPDTDYTQIGGLDAQIQQVRDAVELPFLHRDLYLAYGLTPPKGVLLYGPPGTGKTMIAKAVAASMAARVAERGGENARAAFFNIKGPELLNKYVGETERQIRVIFQRARERASAGMPVIVFFDEMDSLFRTRGSGVSSDVESTIVPQLLSEIDGVESLENVIIIGASNREDMIDPAILRPGRLDVKIRLDRPDKAAALDIMGKYLTDEVPVHASEIERDGSVTAARERLARETVETMFARSDEMRFLEVTYASGATETMYLGDFASGAMIRNVVDKAKKHAIKDELATGERGLRAEHLRQACREELLENEDLPSSTNPDEWSRISGRRGERVVSLRSVVASS